MKSGTVTGLIVTTIILILFNRGCDWYANMGIQEGWTEICGLDYKDARKELSRSLKYEDCSKTPAYIELQRIYKKHCFWEPTEAQEKRFWKFLKDPCNIPPDPGFRSGFGSFMQETGYLIMLLYLAYFPVTFPITIVLAGMIIISIVKSIVRASEVAVKDTSPTPDIDKKKRLWDELEK